MHSQPDVYHSAQVQEACQVLQTVASKPAPKLHALEFTECEFLHLYAAVEHDRNRTLKAMRKGLALPDDLKATDSLWKKLGDVMFRRYKGGRA